MFLAIHTQSKKEKKADGMEKDRKETTSLAYYYRLLRYTFSTDTTRVV